MEMMRRGRGGGKGTWGGREERGRIEGKEGDLWKIVEAYGSMREGDAFYPLSIIRR